MKKKIFLLCICAFLGLGAAFAVADVPTTGTATACASVSPQTIADNGSNIYTIPATTNCTTTTYTIPTVTVTTTVSVNPSFGTALPAPLSPSTGTVVTGSTSQTIQAQFNALTAGESLCLPTGTYGDTDTTAAVLSVSGTASAPITLTACAGASPVVKQMLKITGSYIRVSGLTIDKNVYPTDSRFGQSGSNPGGNMDVWVVGAHDTVERNEIKNATESGVFGDGASSYGQVLANHIHDNGTTSDDHGIYWAGSHGLIANNVIEHNADFGVQLAYTSCVGNIVTNNTLAYNGLGHTWTGSGTVDFSGTTQNTIVNNIAYGNAESGYKTYDNGANTLSHDDAFSNPTGATEGTFGTVTSLLTTDPTFTAPTTGDYSLKAGSPAIGFADPAYVPQTDYNGNARSSADLGAIG